MLDFIRRLLSPTHRPKPMRFVEIVGESRCQVVLSAIAGGKTPDGHVLPVRARLVPDANNLVDPKAVRVEIQGETVGYLSRHQAARFRKRCQTVIECNAKIVGGWDRGGGDTGHFGVELDLTL